MADIKKIRKSGEPTFSTDAEDSPQPKPGKFPETHYKKGTKTTRANNEPRKK